tara:strand:+ start:1245 stop:2231 length:987 start_codon:yes stop_codon:yes gene_type:complete
MDNTVLPYQDESDSSENDIDESSSDDEHSHLLSNNIGVLYNKFNTGDDQFMNMESKQEYLKSRNELFTPKISKIRILVDSKNINHTIEHNTSNYTVELNGDDTTNSTAGFGNYENVIGIRLVKAIVANSFYRVNVNNNIINFMYDGSRKQATLTPGAYTFSDLATEIITQMNAEIVGSDPFTITTDLSTLKYTIESSGTVFHFQQSNSWRLLGLFNMDEPETLAHTTRSLHNVVDHSIHFVDVVIPEIPYIACKHNMSGKHIIDRIPLDKPSGDMVSYINTSDSFMNYFYPMKLSKLTIQLYEDTNNDFYDCQNADNSFEFEIAVFNK